METTQEKHFQARLYKIYSASDKSDSLLATCREKAIEIMKEHPSGRYTLTEKDFANPQEAKRLESAGFNVGDNLKIKTLQYEIDPPDVYSFFHHISFEKFVELGRPLAFTQTKKETTIYDCTERLD